MKGPLCPTGPSLQMVISSHIFTPASRGIASRGTRFARNWTLRGKGAGPLYVDLVVAYRGGLSLNIPICLANVKERKFIFSLSGMAV